MYIKVSSVCSVLCCVIKDPTAGLLCDIYDNQGECCNTPMNLKNKRRRYAYLVPWYRYGSPLSGIPKIQTSRVGRHDDIITAHSAQIADLQ